MRTATLAAIEQQFLKGTKLGTPKFVNRYPWFGEIWYFGIKTSISSRGMSADLI
eukprot:SAG31_NODE_13128_length_891_cov_1.036616_1_plen_53_part_10